VDAAIRTSGFVVINVDDVSSEPVRNALQGESRLRTFGIAESADVRVQSVVPETAGISMQLRIDGVVVDCHSPLRGDHNAMNIAGAVAMATALGVNTSIACTAVKTFRGVQRRFTERGEYNGAILVDDYAHLPAEIEAAIATARTHPRVSGKTIAVFQPNRFHRIAAMADSYADCFTNADVVVITDVYASGTAFIEGVTGELVVNAIRASHPAAHVVWAPMRADIVTAVSTCIAPGDICISMGCGDIETFPDDLMNAGIQ
jgi:UDP-N-acetylmuramate--alanine ligase